MFTMPKKKIENKTKKLHIEIMPANWSRLQAHIEAYNEDPERDAPRIKYAHVINAALRAYFMEKGL